MNTFLTLTRIRILLAGALLALGLTACTPPPGSRPSATAERPAVTSPTTRPAEPTQAAHQQPQATSTPAMISAGWPAESPTYLLSIDPSVAQTIQVDSLPAVPPSPEIMFVDAHPAALRFRLVGFMPGRGFALPYPYDAPQVLFLQTQDFPGYGADTPAGFINQLNALQQILEQGLDPQRCARPLTGPAEVDVPLPFLPWVNAHQVFCAQPKVLSFQGGQGLRYLTFYAQDASPVMDPQVFYTFQGLSADGGVYVAAMLPVKTGVFPEQPPTAPAVFPDPGYIPTLTAQLAQIHAQPAEAFQPSLDRLDEVIQAIVVK